MKFLLSFLFLFFLSHTTWATTITCSITKNIDVIETRELTLESEDQYLLYFKNEDVIFSLARHINTITFQAWDTLSEKNYSGLGIPLTSFLAGIEFYHNAYGIVCGKKWYIE